MSRNTKPGIVFAHGIWAVLALTLASIVPWRRRRESPVGVAQVSSATEWQGME